MTDISVLDPEEEVLEFDSQPEEQRESKYAYSDGIYEAVCTSVTPGITAKGDPKVVFGFTLQSGPGLGVLIQMHVSQKVIWKAEKAARSLGLEQVKGEKVKFPKSKLVGQACRLQLKRESYNGKDRMNIFAVLPPE